MRTVGYQGETYDFENIATYMEDGLREILHSKALAEGWSDQDFFDAYLEEDEDFETLFKYDIRPIK